MRKPAAAIRRRRIFVRPLVTTIGSSAFSSPCVWLVCNRHVSRRPHAIPEGRREAEGDGALRKPQRRSGREGGRAPWRLHRGEFVNGSACLCTAASAGKERIAETRRRVHV